MGMFGTALANVLVAALPMATRFSGWLVDITTRFAAWSSGLSGQTALRDWFAAAGPVVASLGAGLWEVLKGLWGLSSSPAAVELGIQLGGLLSTIGTVLPSLGVLVSGATWLLSAFNALPVPVQEAAIQVAALARIFDLVGGPLLRTLAVHLSTLLFRVSGITPLIGYLVGLFGRFSGWLVPILSRVPLLGGGLASLASPVGVAVAAVAGLVAIGWALYSNWESVAAYLSGPGGAVLSGIGARAAVFGQQLAGWFVGQAQRVVGWWVSNWPLVQATFLAVVSALSSVVLPAFVEVLAFLVSQGEYVVRWFVLNWPLIQRAFAAVAERVQAILAFLWSGVLQPILVALVAFWDENHARLLDTAATAWRLVSSTASFALRTLLNVVKLVLQVLTGDWSGALDTLQTIVRDALNWIVETAGRLLKILANVAYLAWDAIWQVAMSYWDNIRDTRPRL